MKLEDLPDLTDWKFVEVWTLEEAAFIWAGLDPASFPNKTLNDIESLIHPVQFRKAWISRKAFCEAVCIGSLPFVSAYELHEDWNSGFYEKEVDFPKLPDIRRIMPGSTRIHQAALLKWAANKMPSLRQQLKHQLQKNTPIQQADLQQNPDVKLLSYSTPAIELLNTHIEENLADIPHDQRPTPEQQKEWLKQQATQKGLSGREADAIYVVARPPETKQRVQPKSKKE